MNKSMKLICNKCNTVILRKNINLKEGIANCTTCEEYFKIADFLKDEEELRRVQKPHYSKIQFSESIKGFKIKIPPIGWSNISLGLLFTTLIWNIVSWSFLFKEEGFSFFQIPFLVIGMLLIGALFFSIIGSITITVDQSIICVKWSLVGIGYTKKGITKNLKKITENVMYTENYQPVYGVGLFFIEDKKITFGSTLKEEERKWLIGEFYEIKKKYK